jgi:hypothetical protein
MVAKWIFACRHGNRFVAEHLVDAVEDVLWNLEYGDVARGDYQLWQYPSGKVYEIAADRTVVRLDEQYSTPRDDLWLPKLREIKEDRAQVTEAYRRMESGRQSSK